MATNYANCGCCGGGPPPGQPCVACTNGLPSTLTMTVPDCVVSGTTCWTGYTVTLTWDPVNLFWQGMSPGGLFSCINYVCGGTPTHFYHHVWTFGCIQSEGVCGGGAAVYLTFSLWNDGFDCDMAGSGTNISNCTMYQCTIDPPNGADGMGNLNTCDPPSFNFYFDSTYTECWVCHSGFTFIDQTYTVTM